MKLTITNLRLTIHEHHDAALSCEVDGFRYHLWLDAKTLKPCNDTLYKNPPLGKSHEGNRLRRTLHLSQSRGFGAKLTPLMLAAVPDLLPGARAVLQAAIDEREAKTAAAQADRRTKEAAPRLLAAARKVLLLRDPKAKIPPNWDTDSVYRELAEAVAAAEGRG